MTASKPDLDSQTLKNWLTVMVAQMPRGAKSAAARQLGMTPSGFSKLLKDKTRNFDDKTIRCMAWMQMSKAERVPEDLYPLVRKKNYNGLIIEVRRGFDGREFCVWRKAK